MTYRSHSELVSAVAQLEAKQAELTTKVETLSSHVAALLDVVQPYPATSATTAPTTGEPAEPAKE